MWVVEVAAEDRPLSRRATLTATPAPARAFRNMPHRLRDIRAWETLKEAAILPIGLALPKYKARVYHFYKVNA